LGIGIGWFFRTRLEQQQARLAAIIPAEQELAKLDTLINATTDPEFRQRLETERQSLVEKIEDKNGTSESVVAARDKAVTDREAVTKEMSDLRVQLRAALDAWRRPANLTERLPYGAATKLNDLRALIGRPVSALEGDLLTEANAGLKDELPEAGRKVMTE